MQLVTNCSTAREMWERIKLKFEKLRREFHNLKKGDKSLDSHIKEFDSLCDRMRGVGLEISNNEKVLQLTEGLSEMDYDVIVTNILDIEGIEYEEACAKLLIYEASHGRADGDLKEGESFLSQRGGRGRFQSGPGRGRGRGGSRDKGKGQSTTRKCYNCKQVGHLATDCPMSSKCYECQEWDHC